MKKLMGLLVVAGLVVAGCSKTTTPTSPESTQPNIEFYSGPEAAAHGFIAVSPEVGAKVLNVYYNRYKDKINEAKVLRNDFDYNFNCQDIYDLLGQFGVSVPQSVQGLQCTGNIHGQRNGDGLLDWDVFITVLAGYGLGVQGRVGGAGYIDIAASPVTDMDSIVVGAYGSVDYQTMWEDQENGAHAFGSRVATAYGGMIVMDFEPNVYTIHVMGANHYWGDKISYPCDLDLDISINQIAK